MPGWRKPPQPEPPRLSIPSGYALPLESHLTKGDEDKVSQLLDERMPFFDPPRKIYKRLADEPADDRRGERDDVAVVGIDTHREPVAGHPELHAYTPKKALEPWRRNSLAIAPAQQRQQ